MPCLLKCDLKQPTLMGNISDKSSENNISHSECHKVGDVLSLCNI